MPAATPTIRFAVCFAVFWLLHGFAPCADAGDARGTACKQPNFVFILTDDQRWDALGCTGNRLAQTPHIDRLAADGVRFENMFCTTSICAISRATILSGQWERRHGIDGFGKPFSPARLARTFPLLLRNAGYRTGLVGKWGLGGKLPTDVYDFFTGYSGQGDYFPPGKQREAGEHLTARLGDQALEYLDGCTTEQPFLLQVYTKAPHCQDGDSWQFQYDPQFETLLRNAKVPRPVTATEEDFARLPEFLRKSEARRRWKVRFADDEMFQKSVKDYYRLVAGIDALVGRIVTKLAERNLAERTVIVLTSDNGFYLGEHGLAGKWFMHEESIRLPLVIYDPQAPDAARGTTRDEMVLTVDLAPTILSRAGLEVPASMQGRDLGPLLQGEKTKNWRTDFFYEHRYRNSRVPMTEGVRTRKWKFTRYISEKPVYEELFDLTRDPHERRNLADDAAYANRLGELRARCARLADELK